MVRQASAWNSLAGAATAAALFCLSATATLAQDQAAAAPSYTLTGTGGVIAFGLPSFDTGVFGHVAGGSLMGGMAGGTFSMTTGRMNDWDVVVSVNAFGAFGTGTSGWTDTFSGPGTVIITGLTTPANGSITLATTTPAGTSSANIANTNPQGGGSTAVASATGGTNNVGFVAPSIVGNSFIIGALSNDGVTTGGAYGAIADTSGGIFIGTGDLDGLSILTSVTRQIGYGGADVTVSLKGKPNETTGVEVYAGPSFRHLSETDTTNVSVNIPELPPTATIFPEFGLSHVDQLSSSYFGGVVGTNLSFLASPGVVFTLGLEGGAYSVSASWIGQDTYSTCCGDFLAAPFAAGSPTLSVSADPSTYNFANAIAFAVRANGAVSIALKDNLALTLGGNVDYLSQVAQVDHANLTQVIPGQQDASWTNASGTAATSTFSWGQMLNFGVSASLTGSF